MNNGAICCCPAVGWRHHTDGIDILTGRAAYGRPIASVPVHDYTSSDNPPVRRRKHLYIGKNVIGNRAGNL